MVIFLNGKFIPEEKAKVSVFDHGFLYGDGVFERLRTFNGKIWNLAAHTARLFHSAAIIKIHIPWSRHQFMNWVKKTVEKAAKASGKNIAASVNRDFNIRVTLTRGMALKDMRYDFLTSRTPTLCIMVSSLQPWPKEFYEKGIRVITVRTQRELPEIKTISLLPQVIANHQMHEVSANEGLFIAHDGKVTEGTASNFYFIKGGKLYVPDARVLPGTTFEIVKKLARKAKISVIKKVIYAASIRGFQECFITSVTRGIMPVASIDRKHFHSPGKVTQSLLKLFEQYVKANG